MGLKRVLFALLVLSISATGFAADAEKKESPAATGISSPSDASSFFEGVWVGKWPWGVDGVEITVTVGKKNKDGLFGTSYTWERGRRRDGVLISPGSLKAWGKEQGDQLLIEWKNKAGVKSRITLVKATENSVKATYDSDGPLPMRDRADMVSYLKRK